MARRKNTSRIGKDDERMILKDLEAKGYRARRQPGSGNRAVDLQDDIVWFDSPAGKLQIEAKYRDKCQWKTLSGWKSGADILTVRCHANRSGQEGQRMAFLSWDLLLTLVGDAAIRDDLESLRAMVIENFTAAATAPKLERWQTDPDAAYELLTEETDRRDKIQAAHQNPKRPPAKPNKLQGRGFQKKNAR